MANINGGNGDDVLLNQAEDDVIDGGLGEDLADYSNATAAILADLGAGVVTGDASVGADTLISIEGVIGSAFDDILFGSNADPVGANGFEIFEG
ncbi:MAG: hemolysin, partial [Alphaproteobacteria bacterium]